MTIMYSKKEQNMKNFFKKLLYYLLMVILFIFLFFIFATIIAIFFNKDGVVNGFFVIYAAFLSFLSCKIIDFILKNKGNSFKKCKENIKKTANKFNFKQNRLAKLQQKYDEIHSEEFQKRSKFKNKIIRTGNTVDVEFYMLGKEEIPTNAFVIVDVETTGLNPTKDNIIEIAAIKVDLNAGKEERFQSLVKVNKKLNKVIINLTKITDDELAKNGVDRKTAMRNFFWFIEDLPLVAHNAEFDAKFIIFEGVRENIYIENPFVDTLWFSRRLFPHTTNHKLQTLAEELNLLKGVSHRALGDCETTLDLYKKILDKSNK